MAPLTPNHFVNQVFEPVIPKSLIAASLKPFILSILASSDRYGYEIIQHVHSLTNGQVEWKTSTLYPVLHQLESQNLLEAYWQEASSGPPRKYYRLTEKGQRALQVERRQWLDIHGALTALWESNPALAPA